jgi:hypothetical protein
VTLTSEFRGVDCDLPQCADAALAKLQDRIRFKGELTYSNEETARC